MSDHNTHTESSRRSSRRALWSTIFVFAVFVSLATVMMIVTSYDQPNAPQYVSLVDNFLDWPVLAFAIALITLLTFQIEIAGAFKNLYIKRVGRDGLELGERQPQAEAPENERPLNLAPEQETDMNTLIRQGYLQHLREEAKRWWHRYLLLFLTPPTRQVLRLISRKPRTLGELREISVYWNEISRREIITDQTHNTKDVLLILPSALPRSLEVLEKYGLIERYGGGRDESFRITEDGERFVDFEDSPEAIALIDEITEANIAERYGNP